MNNKERNSQMKESMLWIILFTIATLIALGTTLIILETLPAIITLLMICYTSKHIMTYFHLKNTTITLL